MFLCTFLLILSLFSVFGGFLGYYLNRYSYDNNIFFIIIGIIVGIIVGLIIDIISGGLVANFLDMVQNIEILVNRNDYEQSLNQTPERHIFNNVILRSSPDNEASVVSTIEKLEKYIHLESYEDIKNKIIWYKIKTENEIIGWCLSSDLKK